MNTARSRSHRRFRRTAGRCTCASVAIAVIAALFALASMAAASAVAEPWSAEPTPAPAAPSPRVPAPTTHSYDDTHSGRQPEGSSPALWILAGAVMGLVAIAVVLLRADKPARHDLERSHHADHRSRSPAEQQIQTGEGVSDHGEHHRQLPADLMPPRKQPKRSIVGSDHRHDMADHHT